MPVTEFKPPQPPAAEPAAKPAVQPVSALLPVVRVRHVGRRTESAKRLPRPKNENTQARGKHVSPAEAERLVERCNEALASAGVAIHLRLRQREEDEQLELEIHDCTDGHICTVLHDRQVALADLPALLAALARRAGIIVDVVA